MVIFINIAPTYLAFGIEGWNNSVTCWDTGQILRAFSVTRWDPGEIVRAFSVTRWDMGEICRAFSVTSWDTGQIFGSHWFFMMSLKKFLTTWRAQRGNFLNIKTTKLLKSLNFLKLSKNIKIIKIIEKLLRHNAFSLKEMAIFFKIAPTSSLCRDNPISAARNSLCR